MLEAMVVGDLLGPAGGESEELTERNVRDRYLVGVLAPDRIALAADAPASPMRFPASGCPSGRRGGKRTSDRLWRGALASRTDRRQSNPAPCDPRDRSVGPRLPAKFFQLAAC